MKQRIHLLIAALALLACVPSFSAVKNIAHRGGALLAPENTLAAFRNAVALRADYLELDIILSSDDSIWVRRRWRPPPSPPPKGSFPKGHTVGQLRKGTSREDEGISLRKIL